MPRSPIDRRDDSIRTRNKPSVPGEPFQPTIEKSQPGGYASLDGTTALIPTNQLGTGVADGTTALFGDQTFKAAATAAALTTETNARVAADNAEAVTRANADTALQTNITNEATTRATNDASEAAARLAADNAEAATRAAHEALTTTAHGGIVASTDARLTNARTPTAHEATHLDGGSDPIAGTMHGVTEINDVRRLGANVPAFIGRAYGPIANASVTHVGDPGQALLCVGLSNGENVAAIYLLTAAHTVILLVGDATKFTVTSGNAGTFNVYWSAGNARFELENNRGGNRNVTPALISLPQT